MTSVSNSQQLVADIAKSTLGMDPAQVSERLDTVVKLAKVPAAQRAAVERILPGRSEASLLEIFSAARNHRGGFDRAGIGGDTLDGANKIPQATALAQVSPLVRTRQELAVGLSRALSSAAEAGITRSKSHGFPDPDTLKYLETGTAISSFEIGAITELVGRWADVADVKSAGDKLIFALAQEKAGAGYWQTLRQDLSHYWATRQPEAYTIPLIGDVMNALMRPLEVLDLFVFGSRHNDVTGRHFHRRS